MGGISSLPNRSTDCQQRVSAGDPQSIEGAAKNLNNKSGVKKGIAVPGNLGDTTAAVRTYVGFQARLGFMAAPNAFHLPARKKAA
jgi:hypothetical protein